MEHAVEKQGKFRMRHWRPRPLITHPTDPYIFLERKSHTGSQKLFVERVTLWPHYDRYLIGEKHSSSSAARTLVIRGSLQPVTQEDDEFLRMVHSAQRKTTAEVRDRPSFAAADTNAPEGGAAAVGGGAADGSFSPDGSDGQYGETDHNALSSEDDDADLLRSSGGYGSFENAVDEDVFVPAAGLFPNPLLPTSQQRRQRQAYAKQQGCSSIAKFRENTRLVSRTNGLGAMDEFIGSDSSSDSGDDAGEGNVGGTSAARMVGGEHRDGKGRMEWVLRCPTLDGVRALVRALQGIDEYGPRGPVVSHPPVPLSAFRGTVEEIQERLVHKRK